MMQLKAELSSAEGSIQEIESLTKMAKTVDEGIRLLEEKERRLVLKFPSKEEDALKMLSDFAQKSGINLVSIMPQSKEIFLDEGGEKILIDGKTCQRLAVSLEARCSYKALVRYIEMLNENLPSYCVIERLSIHKEGVDGASLNVILDMRLYLLS
ncbi:MAG: hypothetical protein HZB36_03005 [Candidatus Omnitrophica bacterium]|nr:hypothetical protein [Candidatus Omnitrophota bacterium]